MDIDLLDSELRSDEGVRYDEYLDTQGIPTTGVGHNLQVSPLPAGWSYPLNDTQVTELLNQDLNEVFVELDSKIPWWRNLSEVRQRVVANMCFNMGIGTLMQFVNMLNALQKGDYTAAANAMLDSHWATQVGARATRLASAMQTDVMQEPAQ